MWIVEAFKMKLEVILPTGCNQWVLFTHFRNLWDRPFVCNTSFILAVPFHHMFACNKAAVPSPFFLSFSGEE